MRSNKQYISNGVIILIAMLLSLSFTIFPWEEARGFYFEDYKNYVERIYELGLYGQSYLNPSGTILGAITSELLWGYFLLMIANSGIDPEIFLWALSFSIVLSITFFLLKHIHPLLLLIFLFNPLLVDFAMSQHRNALAFSILLWAILIGPKNILLYSFLAIISVFIHTSSLLFFPVYYLGWMLAKRVEIVNLKFKVQTFVLSFCFAVTIVVVKALVLTYLGDRRAGIEGEATSFLYSAFWILLLPIILYFYRGNNPAFFFFVVFNLVLFTCFTFSGDYSSRFLVIQYPFMLIVLAGVTGGARLMLFSLLFLYQVTQWVYWFRVFLG